MIAYLSQPKAYLAKKMLRQKTLRLFTLLIVFAVQVNGQIPSHALSIKPFVERFCFQCHGPQTQTAGINLAALVNEQPLVRNREIWSKVMAALDVGKMPPQGMPQPSASERRRLLDALVDSIDNFDYSTIDNPGFEPMRRLTHKEYDNTIRDLLGVDLKPAQRFPSELTGASGFDNSANTLFLQPSLMERYIAAAERVVELALPIEPKTAAHQRSREWVFVARPGGTVSADQAAEQVLKRFLLRAYRRPPSQSELTRTLDQYHHSRESGQGFEAAIKQVLQAVLISPKFLLRIEAGHETDQPFRISPWELASRLSYFLWASMPDDELFALASRKKLYETNILTQQIQRMLADPKANTLGDVFAAQWLGFQHVGTRIWLDPIDNPWCTDTLMTAMRNESSMFFMSLLRDNQPIRRLIDADYTFVNQELATTLYGWDGIKGEQMRRVRFDDPNRGGILGQGSILALTSNYKETSPVKRGNYILETVLGTPPPPPPPYAGVLDEEVGNLKELSFRSKLEMHSRNATCHACHSRIDPLGFSLENFDYFGRWRDSYHFRTRVDSPEDGDEVAIVDDTDAFEEKRYYRNVYKKIDATGALPDGTSFMGPIGLKQSLIEKRHSDIVRQVVSKMFSYALGRQLEYYDEPAVRKIIGALEENDFRFQTLLQGIVSSYPLQYKKNPSKESK